MEKGNETVNVTVGETVAQQTASRSGKSAAVRRSLVMAAMQAPRGTTMALVESGAGRAAQALAEIRAELMARSAKVVCWVRPMDRPGDLDLDTGRPWFQVVLRAATCQDCGQQTESHGAGPQCRLGNFQRYVVPSLADAVDNLFDLYRPGCTDFTPKREG